MAPIKHKHEAGKVSVETRNLDFILQQSTEWCFKSYVSVKVMPKAGIEPMTPDFVLEISILVNSQMNVENSYLQDIKSKILARVSL